MVEHYVQCYHKEKLVTNFLQKRNKKAIIQKWLDAFVSLFKEEEGEEGQYEDIS